MGKNHIPKEFEKSFIDPKILAQIIGLSMLGITLTFIANNFLLIPSLIVYSILIIISILKNSENRKTNLENTFHFWTRKIRNSKKTINVFEMEEFDKESIKETLKKKYSRQKKGKKDE